MAENFGHADCDVCEQAALGKSPLSDELRHEIIMLLMTVGVNQVIGYKAPKTQKEAAEWLRVADEWLQGRKVG